MKFKFYFNDYSIYFNDCPKFLYSMNNSIVENNTIRIQKTNLINDFGSFKHRLNYSYNQKTNTNTLNKILTHGAYNHNQIISYIIVKKDILRNVWLGKVHSGENDTLMNIIPPMSEDKFIKKIGMEKFDIKLEYDL